MSSATEEKPKTERQRDEKGHFIKQKPDENPPGPGVNTPDDGESDLTEGLIVSERRNDPEREAIRRAAAIDHARRMEPGAWMPLPNGEAIRVQGMMMPSYPGEDATMMLAWPRGMLLEPKPDYGTVTGGVRRIFPRYSWRIRVSTAKDDLRPAETANLHRGDRIRYVETSEIDDRCEFAVYTALPVGQNEYVTFGSMILCEILDPKLVYQKFQGWEDVGIGRAADLQSTVRAEPDTHVEDVTEIVVAGPKKSRRGS